MLALPALYPVLRCPPPPSLVPIYKSTQTTTTDETTTTWSDLDIGTPHPNRYIVLATFLGVNAAPTNTVNGIRSNGALSRQNEFMVEMFKVPAGTVGEVIVSVASSIRKAVSLYVVYTRYPSALASGGDSAVTTTDANIANQKVMAGGCLIYAGGQLATLGTFTTTWNGTEAVVEDVDAQLESASSYTMGHINITQSTDLSDLNMAESASGTKRLACMSFWPA